MRDLMQWHAIEEIEHKAVAIDVYNEAFGGYWMRILAYIGAVFMVFGYSFKFAYQFMRQDGHGRFESVWKLHKAMRGVLKRNRYLVKDFFAYFKPGFHPNQIDDEPLIKQARIDLAAY